jgi:hypothetical protein
MLDLPVRLQGSTLFRLSENVPRLLTNQHYVQLKVCLVWDDGYERRFYPHIRRTSNASTIGSIPDLDYTSLLYLKQMSGTMQNFGLLRADTSIAVLREIPSPELRPGYVLVRPVAVALNPTDWTSLDAIGEPGTIVGCDYAGIVEQVGSGGSNRFKKGDRIAGFAHGGTSWWFT